MKKFIIKNGYITLDKTGNKISIDSYLSIVDVMDYYHCIIFESTYGRPICIEPTRVKFQYNDCINLFYAGFLNFGADVQGDKFTYSGEEEKAIKYINRELKISKLLNDT